MTPECSECGSPEFNLLVFLDEFYQVDHTELHCTNCRKIYHPQTVTIKYVEEVKYNAKRKG